MEESQNTYLNVLSLPRMHFVWQKCPLRAVFLLGLHLMGFFVNFYVCSLLKRGGYEMSALALGSRFTPLSCYWFIYLWSECLPCLLWNMCRKWDPCLCSQALSASIRNVQTVAGTFSTVCSLSAHIFHLLWKFRFHRSGVANSFFLPFYFGRGWGLFYTWLISQNEIKSQSKTKKSCETSEHQCMSVRFQPRVTQLHISHVLKFVSSFQPLKTRPNQTFMSAL